MLVPAKEIGSDTSAPSGTVLSAEALKQSTGLIGTRVMFGDQYCFMLRWH